MKKYYFDSPSENLESIEYGILELESVIKGSMVAIALGLGRIKMDKLYLEIAGSFKEYLTLRRMNINQSTAYGLAKAGENILKYRNQIEGNDIRLSKVLQKMRYVNNTIAEQDPRLWDRLSNLSEREFRVYVRNQTAILNNFIDADNTTPLVSDVYTKGSALIIAGKPVKGINLNEFRVETSSGKRPIVIWVKDNSNEVRRVQRKIIQLFT